MIGIVNRINSIFAFFLPIFIPILLGGISLLLRKFKISDMFRTQIDVRSKSIGIFVNQMVFGLFTFDMWVIISFAEKTRVSYFSQKMEFADKYAIALITLLVHLFTYIYTYTRVNFDEFKNLHDIATDVRPNLRIFTGRDARYSCLFVLSFLLCCLVRY